VRAFGIAGVMNLAARADVRDLVGYCRPNSASDPIDASAALYGLRYTSIACRTTESRDRWESDYRMQAPPPRSGEQSASCRLVERWQAHRRAQRSVGHDAGV